MISDSISDEIPPCESEKCYFMGTMMEGACPTSAGLSCLAFAEACRLRKKFWSAEGQEIGDIVRMMVARGCDKKPPPPDNPEAYLRTISKNLCAKYIEQDIKLQKLEAAKHNEGELANYAHQVQENGIVSNPIEAFDEVNFILNQLPSEPRYPYLMSTRDFVVLTAVKGHRPAEIRRLFPEITISEVKHHQKSFRDIRML